MKVHRDVKTANVLLAKSPATGTDTGVGTSVGTGADLGKVLLGHGIGHALFDGGVVLFLSLSPSLSICPSHSLSICLPTNLSMY
jgi:hypothetical protein